MQYIGVLKLNSLSNSVLKNIQITDFRYDVKNHFIMPDVFRHRKKKKNRFQDFSENH